MLLMVAQNPTMHLSDVPKYFVQTVTDFLLASAENTKNELFLIF